MKKLFAVLLLLSFLLCSCNAEEEKEPVLNPPLQEEPAPEELPQTEPENDYEWEEFIEQMKNHGYTKEDIESLKTLGFSRDEIVSMTWVDVVRGLGMIRFGFEREEVESALEILKNENLRDETFVFVDDSTARIELIEDFIAAVEKGEAAFVHGTGTSNPLYYYFELSYEPGGMMKYSMISEHLVSKTEFYEIYDTEAFYRFKNEEESLTFPKIELWPGEQLEFSSEQDVPGMPVTLEKAIEKATETMFSTHLANDEYEYTKEYLSSFVPKCDGIFDIGGKPYYRIGFYMGESPDGGTYYVCANESEVVFASSEIDGRLMPIALNAKPKVNLKNG